MIATGGWIPDHGKQGTASGGAPFGGRPVQGPNLLYRVMTCDLILTGLQMVSQIGECSFT
jgi:hypothetical protein